MPEGGRPKLPSELEPSELEALLVPWSGHVAGLLDSSEAPVVVGCSGGTDSLALLALAASAGLRPIALHVDHGLRNDAEAVAVALGDAGARLGTPVWSRRAGISAGANLEARARTSRYEALEEARRQLGASCVLVGHNRDDQAETVLLHLLRGSATAGLGAMAPRRGRLVRPLLGLPRSATTEICLRLGLQPVEDPMNVQNRYRRVWLRREVIPFLEGALGSDLRAILARQADVLREESDFLDHLAAQALRELGWPPAIEPLGTLPEALARRVIRHFLAGSTTGRSPATPWSADPTSPPAGLDAVDGVLEVARGRRRAVDLPGGRRVVRSLGRLVIIDPGAQHANGDQLCPVRIALPGRATGLGWRIESRLERVAPLCWPDGRFACVLDAASVAEAVSVSPDRSAPEDGDSPPIGGWAQLRTALPGERFTPLGGGTRTIRRAFAEGGVPAEARDAYPVLAVPGGEVIWVLGYRVAERFRVRPGTRRYLWVEATREEP
ncbi:MAG: tRNA lysidine(34) synthetase TilS [Acidimicrobiia bacterium]